jgi:hypothetical protein
MPLRINSIPIKITTAGIMRFIRCLNEALAKFPKYTAELINGMVPSPKAVIKRELSRGFPMAKDPSTAI